MTNNINYQKDWEIDIKNKSATHKSGIKFALTFEDTNSQPRLEISNLFSWYKEQMAEKQNVDQCNEYLSTLRRQFTSFFFNEGDAQND